MQRTQVGSEPQIPKNLHLLTNSFFCLMIHVRLKLQFPAQLCWTRS